MKKIFKVLLFVGIYVVGVATVSAQKEKATIYDPKENAVEGIKSAIEQAKKEGKHVFIQLGGNWCSWCVMLHKFYSSEPQIDSTMNANYVVYLLNYSKENKNLDILADLSYPQRFGFPVIVILDANGTKLHTQNSVYLEEGRGYNKKNFMEFLQQWSPEAINPNNYKTK